MKDIKTLGDYVLIVPDNVEAITKSGIVLSEQTLDAPNRGVVKAIGNKVTLLKINDHVVYDTMFVQPIEHNENEYFLLREHSILSKID